MLNEKLIAIVEDDLDITDILKYALEENGFVTQGFTTVRQFIHSRRTNKARVNIIDLGLPDQDGMTLIKDISGDPESGTIIITGRREVTDKVICLELGADDYVTKPFEAKEIVARVRSVIRRLEKVSAQPDNCDIAKFAGNTVNFNTYELIFENGGSINLSHAEAKLLKVFLKSPNKLMSRDRLLEYVDVDVNCNYDRSVDVRVSRLRAKLETDPKNPKLLKTVYGAGYLFVQPVEWLDE